MASDGLYFFLLFLMGSLMEKHMHTRYMCQDQTQADHVDFPRMRGPSLVSQVCPELVGVGRSMQAKVDRR